MAVTYPISFKITDSSQKVLICDGDKSGFQPIYRVGQIIFDEYTGKMYLDFHDKRTCYSGDGNGASDENSLHYIGIVTTENWDRQTTPSIKGLDTYTPTKNDVVVYETREYIFRLGDDDLMGWYELGNEDAELTWNEARTVKSRGIQIAR